MKRSLFIPTASVLLAAAADAGSKPAATAAAAKPAAKSEGTVIGISSAVALPSRPNKRGQKNKYPFDKLEIGQSIAIKGMKAENLASTIATNNRKEEFKVFKKNDAGEIVRGFKEIKDAAGNVISTVPGDAIVLSQRVFFALDCDPKKDPEGADVRIFRDNDKVISN